MVKSDEINPQHSNRHVSRQKIILIIVISLIGLCLRLMFLGDIFLWHDETDNFDEQIFKHMSTSLRRYAAAEAQELTLGPAWPIIIAITCRVFGGVVMVGRMPSVFFGSAAILSIFCLVYRLVRSNDNDRFFVPAFFAAALAAISIVQMEFSQRIIPYGAVPFLTAMIIISHLKIVNILGDKIISIVKLLIWGVLYTLICGFSIYLHMSFTIIFASSFILLAVTVVRLKNLDNEKRVTIFGIFILIFLALFLAWIGNAIHTQSGYRYYLAPYYHALNLGAFYFLVTRAYDLLTYNLNLFYNGGLYWPRRLNPVLLPLVIMCILGWYYSASGRFGRTAKHLSFFGMISLFITALLSLLRKYPFGGVRQTLFMSPFIYTFTAFGFLSLVRLRYGRIVVAVIAFAYFALWGYDLPRFYKERKVPYTAQDLVSAWKQNGKLTFYADGGCVGSTRYMLRSYPNIKIEHFSGALPESPFFLISTHWPIENSLWIPGLKGNLKKSGYHTELIIERKAAYPVHPDYVQSLYFPANGLWLYKIVQKEKLSTDNLPASLSKPGCIY